MRIHFIQHVAYESPAFLLQWARENDHTVSFSEMFETAVFPPLNDFDCLVIMGGPMGAYDEEKYEWLKPEKAFIGAAISAGKKVVGICLGSQLIASVLGAKVYPHTQKEIGWWPVKKTGKAGSLLAGLPEEFISFHWHGDTFDLPAGAIHLLQSEACAHQAFVYRDHVLGLQFHMEVTPSLLQSMIENGRAELTPADWIQSEKEILDMQEYFASNNQWIGHLLNTFLQTQLHPQPVAG